MYIFSFSGDSSVDRRNISRFLSETASIDDITDNRLEFELASNRGKHPKWISLMHDEEFRLEATQYVREHGYVKGAPNLTTTEFARWVAEKWDVQVCEETVRLWLRVYVPSV